MVAYPYLYVDHEQYYGSYQHLVSFYIIIIIYGIHLLPSTICFVGNFRSMLSYQSYVYVKGNGLS